ncbi:MAG TPA: hypothetical protein VH814_26340 [Steroidobacteraceae bacterium]|jgi:hypothetical protein
MRKHYLLQLGLCSLLTLAGAAQAASPKLSADEIVARNVAASGGLDAWRGVRTLSWTGKMEAGGNNQRALKIPGAPTPPPPKEPQPQVQLPFVMEMMRSHKSRLEIDFAGQTAIQVYDGAQGWKVRPFLNRREIEAFTPAELDAAGSQADIDGALVDYAAKGTKIALEGSEPIESRDAYRLKLTLKNQHVVHVWIDSQSFLQVKVEGVPRRLDGKLHPVAIFLRDYRAVNGLQIPHVIETVVEGVPRTERILVEKVVVNPRLADSRFARPT